MPLGALVGGVLGDVYGPVAVMYAGGLGFPWNVLYVLAVPALRRMPAVTAVEPEGEPGHAHDDAATPGLAANAD